MNAQRARRLAALSAVGVLLAGGATVATTTTASASAPTQASTNRGCFYGGWWGNCGRGGFGYGFNTGFNNYGYGFNNSPVVVIVVP
ncbi:hypothetical protein OIB37_11485 [Streptomyces sp. NBC_00820]|uniref:hypothetical protein n=1 Tax=Streptomyces sp. NBC_00820 TaxID=2975842 RepID=UPI002ED18928|nr:hypothetical protein OIB37_11485 [Streptomyces sp. NBC_00820]